MNLNKPIKNIITFKNFEDDRIRRNIAPSPNFRTLNGWILNSTTSHHIPNHLREILDIGDIKYVPKMIYFEFITSMSLLILRERFKDGRKFSWTRWKYVYVNINQSMLGTLTICFKDTSYKGNNSIFFILRMYWCLWYLYIWRAK